MSTLEKKMPLLVLSGPTASGKTALSVCLAQHCHAQIVCADSMQIYAGLSIGTARPTEQEMQGVPHHLFGFLSVREDFSVARYAEKAHQAIRQIDQNGSLPMLCGGTGLYIQAVTENLTYTPQTADVQVRSHLKQRLEQEGAQILWNELNAIDPQTAARVHLNDHGRIVRALEVYHTSGITLSQQNLRSRAVPSPYRVCHLTLDYRDRERLYRRIDQRVDMMMQQGLEQEAIGFFRDPQASTAAQAIGYKELRPYLTGECSREQAVEQLKLSTRRYAKRQLSWFRHMPGVKTLYCDDYPDLPSLTEAAIKQIEF